MELWYNVIVSAERTKTGEGLPLSLRVRFSAMLFLQFMMLPAWFNTVVPYVRTLPGGDRWVMWCGMLMGFGTLASPIVGMFADRFLNAERVLALCDAAYALVMAGCFFVRDPALLFVLLLVACFVNMPGWSLSAAIVMANSSSRHFPGVRVFGSLGWVCSAVFSVVGIRFFGVADFDKTPWIFAAGAAAAVAGALVALLQPATPPAAKGRKMNLADALGLRALVLFKDRRFAAFTLLLVASMVPFQWYMGYNTMYLDERHFQYLALTQNLGQVGELGFMLVVPVLVAKLGYRKAMVVGLAALVFRYACFSLSVMTGSYAFDFGGILVHGLVFSLLIVGAQMYVDDHAPKELRNQAQGFILTMMTSVGAFLSVSVFDRILGRCARPDGTHDWTVPYLTALGISAVVMVAMACLRDGTKAGATAGAPSPHEGRR